MFHLAIYGELFAPDFEAILDGNSNARRLKVSTRIEFTKYCIPDWAVTCSESENPLRAVKSVGPYHPDNDIAREPNHNIALTWVIKSKRWKPHWKEIRSKAGPDFQDDFDDGWWTVDDFDQDWRQRMWENVMLCQGLEGLGMIRPGLQDAWIPKIKQWREKIEALDREPASTTVDRQCTLEYPYLLGDLRVCVGGYVGGT